MLRDETITESSTVAGRALVDHMVDICEHDHDLLKSAAQARFGVLHSQSLSSASNQTEAQGNGRVLREWPGRIWSRRTV